MLISRRKESRQPSHVTCYCNMLGDRQQMCKQENIEKPINQALVHICLQVVFARQGCSFLSIHSTAQVTVFKFYPSDPTYLIGGACLRNLLKAAERRLRATEHQSISDHLCFQDLPRFWSTDFPRFSKTLGRSWQWPNSCALLSLDLAVTNGIDRSSSDFLTSFGTQGVEALSN